MTKSTEKIGQRPASARQVIVSVNPHAGRSSSDASVDQFTQILHKAGFDVRVVSDLNQLESEVLTGLESGTLRTLVAAGGDGTASMLADQFPATTPITLLPLGTENLLAKYLSPDRSVQSVANTIIDGWTCRLDAGRANGKVFLVMASCGFDADVVDRLHRKRRGHIRHWSYAKPILKSIGNYRYPKLSIRVDDEEEFSARWAFVFNVPKYAMQLPIVDDADSMDGKLDLCTFRGGNVFNGFRYLFGVLTRQHRKWPDTRIHRVHKIRIESDRKKVPYQIDGDPGGFLPLDIEVLPARLNVLVPAAWIEAKGFSLAKEETRVG